MTTSGDGASRSGTRTVPRSRRSRNDDATIEGDLPPGDPAGTVMAAVVAAVEAAAQRRGLADDESWSPVRRALAPWAGRGEPFEGDGEGDGDPAAVIDAAHRRIAAVFALDEVAADILLVAACADIDPTFAAAYGLLLGAPGPRLASVALAIELAGASVVTPAARVALAATGPLRTWGLLVVGAGEWQLGCGVRVADAVVAALLGGAVPERLAASMALDASDEPAFAALPGVGDVAAALRAGHRLCWIEDPPGGTGAEVARAAFASADIRCVAADLALRPGRDDIVETAAALVRWAGLAASGLILESSERLAGDPAGGEAVRLLAQAPVPVVLIGSCRWNSSWYGTLPVTVRSVPLLPERRVARWRTFISPAEVPDDSLAAYRLTPRQIDAAARQAAEISAITGRPVDPATVAESVRMLGRSAPVRPGAGAVRTTFADLEVPEVTRNELQRLSSWVRLRDSVVASGAVHGAGGKGTGIAALFTGSPGTGKTLAAHAIADTVGLDLMQVDLSGVIDKYIGETEKNLERVFTDAENLNVVLFFDEADALFGKRSEVKDAHDRFANQEIAYLLQRMEQFDGVTILATNLKGNLDVAFSRRLQFIVHFPDPDEATRARLWTSLLATVGACDETDPIDVPALAAAVELCGGDLRNIVLSATYDAAGEGVAIGMRHVTAAAVREYAKLGRHVPAGLG